MDQMDLILPKIRKLESKYDSLINVPESNKDLQYIRKIVGYSGRYKGRSVFETTDNEWEFLKRNHNMSLTKMALKLGHSREWVSKRLNILKSKGNDILKNEMERIDIVHQKDLKDNQSGWQYLVNSKGSKNYQSKSKALEMATKYIKKTYFDGLRLSTRTFGAYNIKILPGHTREGKYLVNGHKKYGNLVDAYNYVYGKITGDIKNHVIEEDQSDLMNDSKNVVNHYEQVSSENEKSETSNNDIIQMGYIKAIEITLSSDNTSFEDKLKNVKYLINRYYDYRKE